MIQSNTSDAMWMSPVVVEEGRLIDPNEDADDDD
jgi:hypothetical protein